MKCIRTLRYASRVSTFFVSFHSYQFTDTDTTNIHIIERWSAGLNSKHWLWALSSKWGWEWRQATTHPPHILKYSQTDKRHRYSREHVFLLLFFYSIPLSKWGLEKYPDHNFILHLLPTTTKMYNGHRRPTLIARVFHSFSEHLTERGHPQAVK